MLLLNRFAAAIACLFIGTALVVASPGNHLFADGVNSHLKIEIEPQSLPILRAHQFDRDKPLQARPSVMCVVREGSNTWTNVALHLKGSLGSFRSIDDTPSLTLNFSKHVRAQQFHGLEKISLNSSVQDPTRVSEKLCRELYRKAGIPVPRAGHATVELNGRQLGIYVLLEGWSRQFIEQHFSDARGPLYEGPFLRDIDQQLLVSYGKTNHGGLQISDLIAAARETNPSIRLSKLERVLDMDRFVRLLAMDLLLWNGDGYALHANNYRIFHDRARERFVFLPHGLDQMLVLPDAPILAGGDGMVAWALLSIPEGRKRILDHIRVYRNTFVTTEAVTERARAIAEGIRLQTGAANQSLGSAHHAAVEGWLAMFSNRMASVDEQIAGLKNLIPLRVGDSVPLTNWSTRTLAGQPSYSRGRSEQLTVTTTPGATGAWVTVQWLEHGRYKLRGRVKATNTAADSVAVKVVVQAPRKRSVGLDWGWDARRRAEHLPRFQSTLLTTTDVRFAAGEEWSDFETEIDLRQPVADISLVVEVSGSGQAVFDAKGLRLLRVSDPGRME